jgi:rubrerythrin
VGGRSRVAAQILAGKGFSKVMNMAGGIRAWNGETALGGQDLGLSLFSGKEAPGEILAVAYSLEQGLRDFYLTMGETALNTRVKSLFVKLADIEILHQESLLKHYNRLLGKELTRDAFEGGVVARAVEGGLTTAEYLDLFKPDLENPRHVISLAMSIEAQALDMYQRVADRLTETTGQALLTQIAREEKMHLTQLGNLMDSI